MNNKGNKLFAYLTFLRVILVIFVLASCSKKEDVAEGAIITHFTRENYYRSSPEVPDQFILDIRGAITPEDSVRLCARMKDLSIDNLSADLLVSLNNYSVNSILIYSVISFDPAGTPSQDTSNYEWLQKALNEIRFIDSTEYEKGSFQMRLQLEKLCQKRELFR